MRAVSYLKATGAFLGGVFGRRQRAEHFSQNGHAVLKGWSQSPDESIVSECRKASQSATENPRLFLYCIAGPHQGEMIPLGKGRERFSKDTDATVVLTPAAGSGGASYQMLINGHVTLSAENGSYFKLNGREEESSEVYDYDELELLGNRFLVLEVNREED